MRLKAIRLAGFKSFVDPTTVPFHSNLSAVIGPNGCGKSNIIDAVRWVMGESSAKTLRGENMADVIFNGSSGRKPLGQCTVELQFDNSDHSLGGQYAAYSEISIKRRVTRDGQSQYFLNGAKCRRKDVTDLFLGTGLGPRSYAIIEQGMISRLIEAKPDELRVFVEEAAGTSRYKERRRETSQRMARTEENLARLDDVRHELDRQVRQLSRQAEAARQWQQLKQQERQLQQWLLACQWQSSQQQSQQAQLQLEQQRLQMHQCQHQLLLLDEQIFQDQSQCESLEQGYARKQQRYYQQKTEQAKLEERLSFSRQQALMLDENYQRLAQDVEELQERLEQDQERQQAAAVQHQQGQPQLAELNQQLSAAQQCAQRCRQQLEQWQQQYDGYRSSQGQMQAREGLLQARLQDARAARMKEQSRLASMSSGGDQQSLGLDLAKATQGLAQQQQQLEAAQSALAELEQQGHRLEQRRQEQQQQRQATLHVLAQQRADLARIEGQLASQAPLDEKWLARQQLAQSPQLAEQVLLRSPRWQVALNTVLQLHSQARLVDLDHLSAQALADLREQPMQLLSAHSGDALPPESSPLGLPSLWQQVQAPASLGVLLSGVFVCEDLAQALRLRPQLAAGQSLVTEQGLWLRPEAILWPGQLNSQLGLQEQAERLAESILSLEDQLEEQGVDLEHLDLQRQQLNPQWTQAKQSTAAAQSLLEQAQQQHMGLAAQQAAQKASQAEREQDRQFVLDQLEALAETILELEDQLEALDDLPEPAQQEQLLEDRDGLRLALAQAETEVEHWRSEQLALQLRLGQWQTQAESAQQALVRTQEQLQARRAQLQAAQAVQALEPEQLQALVDQVQAQLQELQAAEQALASDRLQLEQHKQQLQQQRQHKQEQEQALLAAKEAEVRTELAWQAAEQRLQALAQQMAEHDWTAQDLLAALPGERHIDRWQQQLAEVRQQIQALGPVNLTAIDSHEQSLTRQQYLNEQHEQLQAALTVLSQAIRRIDLETRERFQATFDAINAGFAELFPLVFGGGQAQLSLLDQDLLTTGVSIMARPPGKKNSTIHLLSGGEKALTAIALVFAIFRLNPAPFCLLDEVDAPLDEANVGRYADLVAKMSEYVQFIFITHNKAAMERAEVLLGVTMNEPGVSRLVSVNLAEATRLVES